TSPSPVATASAAASPAASTAPAASPTAAASTAPAGTGSGFYANLSGSSEVPAVNGSATGGASATLSQDQSTLTVRVAAMGTSGAISVGHIHNAPAGTNGDV